MAAIRALVLPHSLRAQLESRARAAFPNECCGLIEGVRNGDTLAVTALYPTRNLESAPDRFTIDPAEHVRLLRALRGTPRSIAGCYHSHPNGRAEPSARDLAAAIEEDFVWLIAAVPGDRPGTSAAFVFSGGGFRPLGLDG